MAAMTEKTEELNVPDGGIGNFIMDDAEMDAAYGSDDTSEDFGTEGIAQFPEITKKMAAMGREGDDTIAHVQTGELIIPADFYKNDPELKEVIFSKLREAGVEDPERYVVGSSANSINPETGAPEFFKFLKKAFKKIVGGVKKVVKGVVKVIKKVAPVVLPIALAMTPLGPIYGAALGSGIGTLIKGGSIKDALKSALIAGVTGGAMKGISNVATGSGTFMSGFSESLANPMARLGQTVSGAQTTFGNVFGGAEAQAANAGKQTLFSKFDPTAVEGYQPSAEVIPEVNVDAGAKAGAANAPPLEVGADAGTDAITASDAAKQAVTTGSVDYPGFKESLMKGNFKDAFFPSGPNASEILKAGGIDTLSATSAQQAAAQRLASEVAPGLIRTYGPLAAAGTAAAAATGMFTPPEQPPLPDFIDTNPDGSPVTGTDLVEADPSKYLLDDIGNKVLNPETGEYEEKPNILDYAAENQGLSASDFVVSDLDTTRYQPPGSFEAPTDFALNTTYLRGSNPGGPFARPYVTTAAEGGPIFPRRNGGIMPDEGTAGKDSVRAMLMPGEFVMTTDAVRGLGNGNLNQGIQNMYSVMRNLESRGRQTA